MTYDPCRPAGQCGNRCQGALRLNRHYLAAEVTFGVVTLSQHQYSATERQRPLQAGRPESYKLTMRAEILADFTVEMAVELLLADE